MVCEIEIILENQHAPSTCRAFLDDLLDRKRKQVLADWFFDEERRPYLGCSHPGLNRLVSRDEQQRKVLFTGQLTKLPAKVETVHVLQLDLNDGRRELDGRCLVEGFEARARDTHVEQLFFEKSGSGAPYLCIAVYE